MSKGSKVESNLLTHPAPITVLLIAKIVQMSAMKVYFQIAECSLSYAKIVQMSAMKVYFQIAECSLSYAKLQNSATKCKQQHLFYIITTSVLLSVTERDDC